MPIFRWTPAIESQQIRSPRQILAECRSLRLVNLSEGGYLFTPHGGTPLGSYDNGSQHPQTRFARWFSQPPTAAGDSANNVPVMGGSHRARARKARVATSLASPPSSDESFEVFGSSVALNGATVALTSRGMAAANLSSGSYNAMQPHAGERMTRLSPQHDEEEADAWDASVRANQERLRADPRAGSFASSAGSLSAMSTSSALSDSDTLDALLGSSRRSDLRRGDGGATHPGASQAGRYALSLGDSASSAHPQQGAIGTGGVHLSYAPMRPSTSASQVAPSSAAAGTSFGGGPSFTLVRPPGSAGNALAGAGTASMGPPPIAAPRFGHAPQTHNSSSFGASGSGSDSLSFGGAAPGAFPKVQGGGSAFDAMMEVDGALGSAPRQRGGAAGGGAAKRKNDEPHAAGSAGPSKRGRGGASASPAPGNSRVEPPGSLGHREPDPACEANALLEPSEASFSRSGWVATGPPGKAEFLSIRSSTRDRRAGIVEGLQAVTSAGFTDVCASRETLGQFLAYLQQHADAGQQSQAGVLGATLALAPIGVRAHPALLAGVAMYLHHPAAAGHGSGASSSSGGADSGAEMYLLPLAATDVVLDAQGNRRLASSLPRDYDLSPESPPPGAGDAAAPLSRAERWSALESILNLPGLHKVVFDAKSALYPIIRCPLTERCDVADAMDPLVAAWLLNPEPFSAAKGTVVPPRNALCLRPGGPASAIGPGASSGSASPAAGGGGGEKAGDHKFTLVDIAAAYRVPLPPQEARDTPHGLRAHLQLLARTMRALCRELAACGMLAVFLHQEMRLAPALAAMETAGIALHPERLTEKCGKIADTLDDLTTEGKELSGCHGLELTSSKQVSEALYNKMGVAAPVHTKAHTKNSSAETRHASTAEEVLKVLDQTLKPGSNGHEMIRVIRGHRKLFKLQTGFINPLQAAAVPWVRRPVAGGQGRVLAGGEEVPPASANLLRLHTCLHQTSTGTGRLSSRTPNLQNLPSVTVSQQAAAQAAAPSDSGNPPLGAGSVAASNKSDSALTAALAAGSADAGEDEEEGADMAGFLASINIRAAFRASAPGYRLVSIDYSQIEMRIAAHMSGDASMLRIFASTGAGQDIYAALAASIFRVGSVEGVSAQQRASAKTIALGLLYGMAVPLMARKLGISDNQATEEFKKFKSAFPGLVQFTEQARAFAKKHGYTLSITGRRRYLLGISSDVFQVRAYAERQVVNTIVQGTAADVIKLAMIMVDRNLRIGRCSSPDESRPLRGRLLMQIHDELLLEAPADAQAIQELVDCVLHIMTVRAPQALAELAGGPQGPFTRARAGDPAARDAAALLGGSPTLRVPLTCSVEVGESLGAMTKWKGHL